MGRRRRRSYSRRRKATKKQPMLDVGRELEFKYDVRRVLERTDMDEKVMEPFIATLFSKGSRMDLYKARDYVEKKKDEGLFGEDEEKRLHHLLKRYKRWR